MTTNKTRTNKPARSQAKSPAHVDPIAKLQADVATLGEALHAILAHLGEPAKSPAHDVALPAAKSPKAKTPKNKPARVRDEAKIAAHNARKQAYADARETWAGRDWADVVKFAASEIRKNRKAGTRNANIADVTCVRVWLTSPSNQGFMAARKNAGVTYADAMAQLEKAAK